MKININKIKLGYRISNIRNSLDLTLEEFGKKINASKSSISEWEKGKNIPNKKRLSEIAKLGNITVNELLYGSIDEFLENNIENIIKEKHKNIDFNKLILNAIYIRFTDNYDISDIANIENEVLSYFENYLQEIQEKNKEYITFLKGNLKATTEAFNIYIKSEDFDKLKVGSVLTELKKDFSSVIDEHNFTFSYFRDINNFFDSFENKIFSLENWYILEDFYYLVKDNLNGFNGYYQSTTFANVPIDYLRQSSEPFPFDYGKLREYMENTNYSNGFAVDTFPYKPNKYGLTDFDIVIGLYIDTENTTYFLANYSSFDNVPLNKEADYFILNHDNTYQISKITEKPPCKYLAPIIGKLE